MDELEQGKSDVAEWLLRLTDMVQELDAIGYPVQLKVYAEPLGDRILLADLGNHPFEVKYPPLRLLQRMHGDRRGEADDLIMGLREVVERKDPALWHRFARLAWPGGR